MTSFLIARLSSHPKSLEAVEFMQKNDFFFRISSNSHFLDLLMASERAEGRFAAAVGILDEFKPEKEEIEIVKGLMKAEERADSIVRPRNERKRPVEHSESVFGPAEKMTVFLIVRLTSHLRSLTVVEFTQRNHFYFRISSNEPFVNLLMSSGGVEGRSAAAVGSLEEFKPGDEEKRLVKQLMSNFDATEVKKEVDSDVENQPKINVDETKVKKEVESDDERGEKNSEDLPTDIPLPVAEGEDEQQMKAEEAREMPEDKLLESADRDDSIDFLLPPHNDEFEEDLLEHEAVGANEKMNGVEDEAEELIEEQEHEDDKLREDAEEIKEKTDEVKIANVNRADVSTLNAADLLIDSDYEQESEMLEIRNQMGRKRKLEPAHHSRLLFDCPAENCTLSFGSFEKLKEHVERSHSDEEGSVCDVCKKAFYSIDEAMEHFQKREKIGCCACGILFDNSMNLTNHLRIHFGSEQDPCAFCGKRFTQKILLEMHKRTHTGQTSLPSMTEIEQNFEKIDEELRFGHSASAAATLNAADLLGDSLEIKEEPNENSDEDDMEKDPSSAAIVKGDSLSASI